MAVIHWLWAFAQWTLLVRLWFQGPLSIGRWTIPDHPGLLLTLAFGVVLFVLRAYHVQSYPSPLRWGPWVRQLLRRFFLNPYTVGILAVLFWIWLGVQTYRARVARGFTTSYFAEASITGEPVVRVHQPDFRVQPELLPTPGKPFAVLWQGYFYVNRGANYHFYMEADDAAVGWLYPADRPEEKPRGWGQGFRFDVYLPPGWHTLSIALINRAGPYGIRRWSLCAGETCLKTSDFFPTVPTRSQLRRARLWQWGWGLSTVGLMGLGILWVRRRVKALSAPARRALFTYWLGVGVPLMVGMGLRVATHELAPSLFSSDEGVYYSMALDILEGRGYNSWKAPPPERMWPGRPTVEYGQAYGGTLVAHLAALLMALFGRSPKAILFAMDLLVVVYMTGVYALATALWNERVGRWALWLMAVPHFQQLMVERVIVRADIMAITPWVLWLIHRLWTSPLEARERRRYDLWLGFLAGTLQWIHPSTVSVILPVGFYMLLFLWIFRREGAWRSVLYFIAGVLMGILPVLFWNMRHDWIILRVPSVVAQTPSDWFGWVRFWAELPSHFYKIGFLIVRDIWGILWIDPNPFCRPMLLSCQISPPPPPTESLWFAAWVGGVHLLALGSYALPILRIHRWRLDTPEHRQWLVRMGPVVLLFTTLAMNLLGARGGAMVDARYLAPLYAVFPILVAWTFAHALSRWMPGIAWVVIPLILVVHIHALAYGYTVTDRRTHVIRGLVAFLQTQGVRSVITNYETAYWLMWMTDEAIRAAPGYSPPKDRHTLHTNAVISNPRSAVLLPTRQMQALRLEEGLTQRGIRYRRQRFRIWVLLKDLSEPYWQKEIRFF